MGYSHCPVAVVGPLFSFSENTAKLDLKAGKSAENIAAMERRKEIPELIIIKNQDSWRLQ